jgi:hypothetical protein
MLPAMIAAILIVCIAVAIWHRYLRPKSPAPRIERMTTLDGILPVLRNVHGDDDTFRLTVVNSIVCDGMGIFAAKPSKLPNEQQFVQYIMKSDLAGFGSPAESIVMRKCLDNLARNLEATVIERGEDKMLSLRNRGMLGAAAIAIPGLYANCVEWLGGEVFIAGAPNLDTLLVCRADSSFREDVERAVDRADYSRDAIDFDPSLFELTASGIRLTVPAG